MKLYVKCDRCGVVAATLVKEQKYGQQQITAPFVDVPPDGWQRIEGNDLCGKCAGVVSLAITRAVLGGDKS